MSIIPVTSLSRLVICASILIATAAPLRPQMTTTRVSVNSTGAQANHRTFEVAMSADGRFCAFTSAASNLVSGDTNNSDDVFVHDRQIGQTTRVSVGPAGLQANYFSGAPSVSADGRYVAFHSDASNLVPGDSNGYRDIFLHDRQDSQTRRISVSSAGAQADHHSDVPSVSANGRYVVFSSTAWNLAPGDTGGHQDVFVHHIQTGHTTRVSVNSAGVQGNLASGGGGSGGIGGNQWAAISADGRFIAFVSWATNLVAGDTNGLEDIFVHDRTTATTRRVSVSSSGAQANYGAEDPSISADGRYVAFTSWSDNLVPNDPNFREDIFVHDLFTGQTTAESINAPVGMGHNGCWWPAISGDGRFVAFVSYLFDLPGYTPGAHDIIVRDRLRGQWSLASMSSTGVPANSNSWGPSISAGGRYVAFCSYASNLVSGDTNNYADAFVRDHGCDGEIQVYCTAKVNSAGCTPTIGSTGAPSASVGSGWVIEATNILPNKPGLFFYSKTGPASVPFQGGFLCAQSPIKRTNVRLSTGSAPCGGRYSMDFNAYIATGADPALVAGQTMWGQWWSRDPGFDPPRNIGLTDGIRATLCP